MQPPVWPGRPFPLGATWDGEGTNFSLFSERAERVELCLFGADGDDETEFDEDARWLRVRRGGVELLMNFSDAEVEGVPAWSGAVRR